METQKLIGASHEFMNNTSKVDYVFTTDEMIKLTKMIAILESHIAVLDSYEINRIKLKNNK